MKKNVAVKLPKIYTAEGALATRSSNYEALERQVMSCMLWEDNAYSSGNEVADRISALIKLVPPVEAAGMAIRARKDMKLRHVPLFILSELSKRTSETGVGPIVRDALTQVISRPDELGEFLSMYWGKKKHPIANSVRRGLAAAFESFDEYQFAKWNRDVAIKLRDVMFMVHPKPATKDRETLYKKIAEETLTSPDTWEVELSAGKDKKAVFERLLIERKLGGMATLMNLRNMEQAGVDRRLVIERLEAGIPNALPFRFITARRHTKTYSAALEKCMLNSLSSVEKLPGTTILVVDVSGSMGSPVSSKSEISRYDAAAALVALANEICQDTIVFATAGSDYTRTAKTEKLPYSRGFAAMDSVSESAKRLGGGGIFLTQCMDHISNSLGFKPERVIVFTDEQDCDRKLNPAQAKCLGKTNYIVNVSTEKHGIVYGTKWTHINGFSENVLEFIRQHEAVVA